MFELPHFATELLIVLPCAQIIVGRLKILAASQVSPQLPPGDLGLRLSRALLAPNVLRARWEHAPAQRRLAARLRANKRVLSCVAFVCVLAATNALVAPLRLEETALRHPLRGMVVAAARLPGNWTEGSGVTGGAGAAARLRQVIASLNVTRAGLDDELVAGVAGLRPEGGGDGTEDSAGAVEDQEEVRGTAAASAEPAADGEEAAADAADEAAVAPPGPPPAAATLPPSMAAAAAAAAAGQVPWLRAAEEGAQAAAAAAAGPLGAVLRAGALLRRGALAFAHSLSRGRDGRWLSGADDAAAGAAASARALAAAFSGGGVGLEAWEELAARFEAYAALGEERQCAAGVGRLRRNLERHQKELLRMEVRLEPLSLSLHSRHRALSDTQPLPQPTPEPVSTLHPPLEKNQRSPSTASSSPLSSLHWPSCASAASASSCWRRCMWRMWPSTSRRRWRGRWCGPAAS
jgi:hypothetical protein